MLFSRISKATDMPLIEWNSSLATGQMEIDAQHTVLVAILNRLYDAISAGEGDGTTGRLLHELVEYTHYHFASEEALMDRVPAEIADAHKAKHAALIARVSQFQQQFDCGEIKPEELLVFLKEWLIQHISGTDRNFVARLAKER